MAQSQSADERVIAPGVRLPSIALASTRGGMVDLSQLAGRSVVFVYPYTGRPGVPDPPGWDDIPGAHGSTPQAQGFGDQYGAFQAAGVEVYGLSGQASAWQQEATRRLGLPYALLSDEGLNFAGALGLPRFAAGERLFLTRLTLLIADGNVTAIFHPVLDPAGHARAVLERIAPRVSS